VNFAASGRVICPNGKQRQLDLKPIANFSKAREISSVATVENRTAIRSDDEPAEIAVRIRKEPRPPMVSWCERNFERAKLDSLPVIELVHDMKSEIVHEITNACRNDNGLVRSDAPQGASVEVVEVRMRHQDIIDGRQMMNFEPGLFQSFDNFEPFRPDRVDQDVDFVCLNQK
jgi:hypothetical protein